MRRLGRELLRFPRLAHAARGMQMRVRPPHPPLPSLRLDVDRYAPLFASSENNCRDLLTPWRAEFDWPLGRIYNGTFESIDVELYHSVLRTYRPKLVIEVGGGHSSRWSTEALARNGGGHVIVVDPRPRVRVPRDVEYIQARVEDVELSLFDRLGAGDVLFIDSSHTTGEARYHVAEILPRLAWGVVIHHHDVLFPYDAYYLNDRELYGEPDVLLEFYESRPIDFEVLVGAAWVCYRDRRLVEELAPSSRRMPSRVPGSLWTRRR